MRALPPTLMYNYQKNTNMGMRICDLKIQPDFIVGRSIGIDELFDRRILVEKVIIDKSNFDGKNSSGLCMQMQICLATFNTEPDAAGDYYVKDNDGCPVGERRSCFTGSDILIDTIKRAEIRAADMNKENAKKGLPEQSLFPIDTTIVKVGKCFQFT
jgi:hypothetical protein